MIIPNSCYWCHAEPTDARMIRVDTTVEGPRYICSDCALRIAILYMANDAPVMYAQAKLSDRIPDEMNQCSLVNPRDGYDVFDRGFLTQFLGVPINPPQHEKEK